MAQPHLRATPWWGGLMQVVVKRAYEEKKKKMSIMVQVAVFFSKRIINYLYAWVLLLIYGISLRSYVRPNVDAAALAAFDLGPDNMLRYDLAPNVTFFNDHRAWALRINDFSASVYFNGTRLSPPDDTFPKFKDRLRQHRTVYPVLRGRASNISATVAEEFSWQRAQGWFTVELRLRATLSYLIWSTRYVWDYEYKCWLPFPSNTTLAVISGVKCSKGTLS
ncbi:hypothetical protein ZWY2020_009124 [Hordeum vulgare]|nr:hypothetical protein ZWY2020_009124 [Hordeum vulgare]